MKQEKLIGLRTGHLRHAEFTQFITRFLDDVEKEGLDFKNEEVITALVKKIKAALPAYQASLGQIRASEKSASISAADELRDTDLQALRDAIKPYRAAKREEETAAYESLKRLFEQYKGAHSKHYEEETALIVSLLDKLKTAPYKDQLDTLAIGKFVDNLTESHTAFEQLFASRSQEKLQKVSYDVKQLRKEVATPYQQLADYVEILSQVKSDEFYQNVLSVLNNSRKYYADILARRKGKEPKVEAGKVAEIN